MSDEKKGPLQVSVKISGEDKHRLAAIADAARTDEKEVLNRLYSGDYGSYDVDIIAQSEEDPDEVP
jgi:hypothetical protein